MTEVLLIHNRHCSREQFAYRVRPESLTKQWCCVQRNAFSSIEVEIMLEDNDSKVAAKTTVMLDVAFFTIISNAIDDHKMFMNECEWKYSRSEMLSHTREY